MSKRVMGIAGYVVIALTLAGLVSYGLYVIHHRETWKDPEWLVKLPLLGFFALTVLGAFLLFVPEMGWEKAKEEVVGYIISGAIIGITIGILTILGLIR